MRKDRIKEVFSPKFWLELNKEERKRSRSFLIPKVWDTLAKDYDELEETAFYQGLKGDVLQEMEKRGALKGDYSLIDVACGTGSYTVEFAKRVREVWALDISSGMLEVLRRKLKTNNLQNVKIIQADWFRFKLEKSFHTVFVSMSPIVSDLKQVERLLKFAQNYLIVVHWAGIRKNELLEEVVRRFFGRRFQARIPGIILLFNYLYSKGLAPDLKFYQGYFQRQGTIERVWERFKTRLMAKGFHLSSTKEKKIMDFLSSQGENGRIVYRTKVRIGGLFLNLAEV